MKFLFGLVVLLASSGCVCHRGMFYPLGIYSVPTTNDLSTVRQAGFNLVAGPPDNAYLDAARSLGLKVLASPGTSAGTNFNALAARRVVAAFDAHPALWAWYLVDEPDLNRIQPADVIAAHRFLKNQGAKKPTALVIYHGPAALHYANVADITMIDRYPIPWLPLANFPQHVRMTRLALGKKKPLIAVIQAFDWSAYPKELSGEKNLRPPTSLELRCMTYCALAQRATGLFYYGFNAGRWKIQEHPEVWEALKRVVSEVNDLLPLFQAEHLWWPVNHEFGDPTIRFNGALDSSITSVLLRVKRGNAAVAPGDYILAVNNTEKKHVYSFALPNPPQANPTDAHAAGLNTARADRKIRASSLRRLRGNSSPQSTVSEAGRSQSGVIPVLGEDRIVAVLQNWVTDEFEPYAVHIYGLMRFE